MILTPGSVFYYSGLVLLVLGNTLGVVLGVLMILAGFWLWQKEDEGYLDYDDEDEDDGGCVMCGAEPGEPCHTPPNEINLKK